MPFPFRLEPFTVRTQKGADAIPPTPSKKMAQKVTVDTFEKNSDNLKFFTPYASRRLNGHSDFEIIIVIKIYDTLHPFIFHQPKNPQKTLKNPKK